MIKINKYSLVFIHCLLSTFCFSQNALVEKANKQFQLLAFNNAIKNYELAIEKGWKSEIVYRNLADSYYNNAQFEKATVYYKLLFKMNKKQEAICYFRFSESLKSLEKYEEANLILNQFAKDFPKDSRAKLFLNNQNYLEKIIDKTNEYKIESINLNSKNIEYGGFINNHKFYFTAYKEGNENLDKWTNQSYSRIYVAPIDSLNIGKPALVFPENIRPENESTAVLTKDGKTIYFTRNDQQKVKRKGNEKPYFLKIYKANLVDNEWKNIVELPFCSSDFNTANPALSFDEKTLYFASDRPGTKGLSDIYKVAINKNGTYGKPINLAAINTPARESFPFISDRNTFYFASDGHNGLGGLDIYSFDFKDNTTTNLGKGINSPQDDFAFSIKNEKTGYFSSNRAGGMGFDDIYQFTKLKLIENSSKNDTIVREKPIAIGDDLAKLFHLNPIYFDLDKWNITNEAAIELDKIVAVLNQNPNISIAINSHTDCRRSHEYNEILSRGRAECTKNYLIYKGIDASRLTANGFGETQLINHCADGIDCTEAEHQQNRRSEFVVLKL